MPDITTGMKIKTNLLLWWAATQKNVLFD